MLGCVLIQRSTHLLCHLVGWPIFRTVFHQVYNRTPGNVFLLKQANRTRALLCTQSSSGRGPLYSAVVNRYLKVEFYVADAVTKSLQ